MMNLRQIEVFRAVMITRSIAAAADLLHVSSPAVSRLLSHAETQLGFALFERIRGRLYATPEARRLLEEVELVYRGVRRIDNLAQEMAARKGGLLRVACSPSIAQTLCARAVARFSQDHPDTRITFELLVHQQMKERLLEGKVDVALSLLPMEHPNLKLTPIAPGSLVCIFPIACSLSELSEITLADLRPFPVVSYCHYMPLAAQLHAMYEAEGETLKPAIEVDSVQMACSLVALGAGVAIVHEHALGAEPNGLGMRRLHGAPSFMANLVQPRYEPLSQVAHAFVQVLQSELTRQGLSSAEPALDSPPAVRGRRRRPAPDLPSAESFQTVAADAGLRHE